MTAVRAFEGMLSGEDSSRYPLPLILGFVGALTLRGIIRAKNQTVVIILKTSARHRISAGAYKFCCIPGVLSFTGGVGFRGWGLPSSLFALRKCTTCTQINGDKNSQQSHHYIFTRIHYHS
jgi:hypothetical protein